MLIALAALVVASLLAGCGVAAQDVPEPVPTEAPAATRPGTGDQVSGPHLTVFLVRGAALAPVQRRIHAATPATALEQVAEGPTRAEAAGGIRTALPPELVGVEEVLPTGSVTVSVTRGFTGITGGNQLLAVAQVVWTLTDLPAVDRVRFTVEGVPVEVPTDAGLSAGPVDRDDFASVAPQEPPPSETPSSSSPAGDRTSPPR
ncbi:GerMN domain-containing protein [Blastococcus litoris]|uniref:GerMN domain-containing protein n=1 Tax=Blastococcus litoris TaxID=2171622 RepID=UPI0013E04EF2|nr:GerMN domain-containing protein [Blastococcus litoris]